MTDTNTTEYSASSIAAAPAGNESGFTITEFLVSALLLLVVSAPIFGVMAETQQAAGYQVEVQAVLNNSRIAMQTMERHIRQAGNDPFGCGLAGIWAISPTEVRIRSDLTGSAGPGNPDKGDPDGDIDDSGENLTLRFNEAARTLEVVPFGGSAQIAANYISGLAMQFYDANGNPVAAGSCVRLISVTVSGASHLPDPRTGEIFGLRMVSNIKVLT
jgi:Tfp pilus assembly protein PilW